jgi:hypothetical protein
MKGSNSYTKAHRLGVWSACFATLVMAWPLATNARVIASAGRSCDSSTTQSAFSDSFPVSAFSQGDSGRAGGSASPGSFLSGFGAATNTGLGCGWGGGGYDNERIVVTGLGIGEIIPVTAYIAPTIDLEVTSTGGFGAASVAFAASSINATIGRDEYLYNTGSEILHFTTRLGEPISREIYLPIDLGLFAQFLQVQVSAGAAGDARASGMASISIGRNGGALAQFFVPDDFVYSGSGNFSDIRVGIGGAGVERIYRRSELFGAVPEPSEWVMMISGLWLVGVSLRLRRAARSVAPRKRPV